jgi:AcrR family transcriptional regulator
MANKTKRGAKSRAPLTRERVLRAAITIVDKSGLESLSMRKVGEAVGVEAMSLYRHVTNRDDILDGIVDLVVSEIEVPGKGAEWKIAMRQRAISAHHVLLRHPWAAALIESRANITAARLRYADTILGIMRQAGFSIAIAYRAFLALDSYIYGFTLQEVNWPYPADEVVAVTERMRPHVPAETYPNVDEVMTHVVKERASRAGSKRNDASPYAAEFEFGLDLILDGVERLLSS